MQVVILKIYLDSKCNHLATLFHIQKHRTSICYAYTCTHKQVHTSSNEKAYTTYICYVHIYMCTYKHTYHLIQVKTCIRQIKIGTGEMAQQVTSNPSIPMGMSKVKT